MRSRATMSPRRLRCAPHERQGETRNARAARCACRKNIGAHRSVGSRQVVAVQRAVSRTRSAHGGDQRIGEQRSAYDRGRAARSDSRRARRVRRRHAGTPRSRHVGAAERRSRTLFPGIQTVPRPLPFRIARTAPNRSCAGAFCCRIRAGLSRERYGRVILKTAPQTNSRKPRTSGERQCEFGAL